MAEGGSDDIMSMSDSFKDDRQEMRLVLLGKTGSGKSATGNSILWSKAFTSCASHTSVTETCKSEKVERFGKNITVVDTPGFFDTNTSMENFKNELLKFFVEATPGPHAFIVVLSTARFTEEEECVMNEIEQLFGDSVFRYSVMLFPKADDMKADGILFKDFISRCPSALQNIIAKCGKRVIFFNNRASKDENDAQVIELLKLVEEIVDQNKGKCYTNEVFQGIQKEIESKKKTKEEQRMRKWQKYMSKIQLEVDRKFADKIRNDNEKLEYNKMMISKLHEIFQSTTDQKQLDALKDKIGKYEEENAELVKKIARSEEEKLKEILKEKEELERKMKQSAEQKDKSEVLSTLQTVKCGSEIVTNVLSICKLIYDVIPK